MAESDERREAVEVLAEVLYEAARSVPCNDWWPDWDGDNMPDERRMVWRAEARAVLFRLAPALAQVRSQVAELRAAADKCKVVDGAPLEIVGVALLAMTVKASCDSIDAALASLSAMPTVDAPGAVGRTADVPPRMARVLYGAAAAKVRAELDDLELPEFEGNAERLLAAEFLSRLESITLAMAEALCEHLGDTALRLLGAGQENHGAPCASHAWWPGTLDGKPQERCIRCGAVRPDGTGEKGRDG